MIVVIFHLGRSFSIVPQARTLVRTGPYKFVRNPLYLAEEVALLGTLLQFYSLQRWQCSCFTARCRFAGYSMRKTSYA